MKENDKKNTPLIEEEDSYGKSENSNNDFDEEKLKVNKNPIGQSLSDRQEMIQDFKKISSQVNDLSKTVMIELKKQGENVTRLEDQAKIINKNAKEVKNETNETNEINERNIRKSIWVILGLVVILIILVIIFRIL